MKNLLRIEFFVQRKFIKSLAFGLLFMSIIFLLNRGSQGVYFAGGFIIFFLILTTIEVEKRSKVNIYINSLPIKKRNYIISKYISALIYLVLVNIVCYILYKILGLIFKPEIELNTKIVMMTLAIELIYISIIEPIFIILSCKYYRIANIVFSGVIISILYIVTDNLKNIDIISKIDSINKFNLIFFIMSIIVFFISFLLTNFIYKRMDVK